MEHRYQQVAFGFFKNNNFSVCKSRDLIKRKINSELSALLETLKTSTNFIIFLFINYLRFFKNYNNFKFLLHNIILFIRKF